MDESGGIALAARRALSVAAALLAAALIAGTPLAAGAQNASIRGFVTSAADGEPLPGVNVVVEGMDGGLDGTASDSDGFYTLSRLDPGTYVFRASFIGFASVIDTLSLPAGITVRDIAMVERQTELDEVVVESERETVGAAGITAGLQTVRAADIDLVPMPDLSADLVNYLTVLPGVVSQGDQGGQLFIRGGEPTQNLVLLDGIPIYQPFHMLGFYSAFPSEIINTADVYAGGFGGRFGGRLSSVIDISARTGNKQLFAGAATAAPFVASFRLEGPLVRDRISVLGSWRQSLVEQVASRLVDAPLPFQFSDGFGKVHANIGQGAQLSVTALHTSDTGRLGVDPAAAGPHPADEVYNENLAVGTRFIFLPSDINLFAEILLSRTRFKSTFGPPDAVARSSVTTRTGVDANVTQYYGRLDLNWGIAAHLTELDTDLSGLFQNIDASREFVTETSIYVEPVYRSPIGLRIEPSLRVQAFPSKGLTFFEPRLRLIWNGGIHRLSAAAGLYHQEVVGLNDRRNVGDVFTAWTTSPRGVVPEARHAILGWRASAVSWLDLSVEVFYKKLDELMVPEWTAFPRFTTRLSQARGRVRGADLRMEAAAGPAYLAVNYGYAEVDYFARVEALEVTFGEEETKYNPPHDRTHQIGVVGSLTRGGFEMSARWQFGSGLPYSTSMGFDRFVLLDSLVNVTEDAGRERVLYHRPYTGRLPTYHRFDVTLEYRHRLSDGISITTHAGVINVYNRLNLFFLDLFTLRRVNQLPLIPSFGIKLEYD